MKTIKATETIDKVIELLKEESSKHSLMGLCHIIYICELHRDEIFFLKSLLQEKIESNLVFYDFTGREVQFKDQFIWPPRDLTARLSWLIEKKQEHLETIITLNPDEDEK